MSTNETLICRKVLLLNINFILFKTNFYFQDFSATEVGLTALKYVEEELLNQIREAAEAAVEAIQDLRAGK